MQMKRDVNKHQLMNCTAFNLKQVLSLAAALAISSSAGLCQKAALNGSTTIAGVTANSLSEKSVTATTTSDTKVTSTSQPENETVTATETIEKKTSASTKTSKHEMSSSEDSAVQDSSTERTSSTNGMVVALALGGGGPRGAAHLGVLKVFQREHIPIDMIVGTSMGAIFGGLYSAGLDPDAIVRISDKQMARAYYTVPIPVRVALIPLFYLPHIFGYHPFDGLYRGNKFAKWLDRSVSTTNTDISQFKPRFAAVAANLLDGKSVTITHGDLGRALQASSAIPFLRRPVLLQDKLLVDGGIVCNLPVKQARKLGADFVIAVDVDEKFDPPSDPNTFRKIGSVPPRVVSMILAKVDEDQIVDSDVHLHPNVDGISLLSKSSNDARRAMAAGEAAAEAALPEIRKKLAEKISIMGKQDKTSATRQ
jgi:NTE family protein